MSVLLQDKGTDAATVAGMLGHSSTKYVQKTYQQQHQAVRFDQYVAAIFFAERGFIRFLYVEDDVFRCLENYKVSHDLAILGEKIVNQTRLPNTG